MSRGSTLLIFSSVTEQRIKLLIRNKLYPIERITNTKQIFSHFLLSPAVLLHQAHQYSTARLIQTPFMVIIWFVQPDFKLGIGPVCC